MVLPEHLSGDTLSLREQEFFAEYNAQLSSYLAGDISHPSPNPTLPYPNPNPNVPSTLDVDLDLTNDLEPPRELLIEIRYRSPTPLRKSTA